MGKILGLDMGSASIGWAVIDVDDNSGNINALGSRIISLLPDDVREFTSGNTITKNAERTTKRTQRKGYDRYQLRRKNLTNFLRKYDMLPGEELIKLPQAELWGLRARAVSEPISECELGRVLYHLNQKRGYKSAKDDVQDSKQRDYVKAVMGRYAKIGELGVTVGQYFYQKLSAENSYRTKEQVFPRKAYLEEFDAIVETQRVHHPTILTKERIEFLRNEIIYYQRPLKSCKHLVSLCEFEKRTYIDAHGRKVGSGPKVAPRSSPLAQICKIWESVNNVVIKNRKGEELYITREQRQAMFAHLSENERLTMTDLYSILGIAKSDGWWGGKSVGAKSMGNTTKSALLSAIGDDYADLLRFNLKINETVDIATGEIRYMVSDEFQNEPLYRLWHIVYSIEEREELAAALEKQFGITEPTIVDNLFVLDFVKAGYSNKSAKSIRRIIPYLQDGLMYSKACEAAGFRHSESLTNEENATRELKNRLKLLQKNELRQPIVETILNQMINVVNALMDKYGPFDEIRVELARELKQSREERYKTTTDIAAAERKNGEIATRISDDYGLTPTKSRVQKYKMWQEAEHKCFYCGTSVGVVEFLRGFDVEVEHILPKSLFFDDSFSNKVCSCRSCNKEKNNRTAYDYMRSKSDDVFNSYLERIERYYKEHKIGKSKYERLLTAGDKIPTDFIDRQLRESQYIARKSREILSDVCRNVTSTSGSVTAFVRRTWGWDKVLHDLNFERYKAVGLIQTKECQHQGNHSTEGSIVDWNKREDHRHHAIDALVIACTTQGIIQRLNNLSTLKDEQFKPFASQDGFFKERQTQLERYLLSLPHFSYAEVCRAAEVILVSFKAGKKAATFGKRYVHRGGKRILMQSNVVVPRGALSEESVYGQITRYAKNRKGETITRKEYVIKYPIVSLKAKNVDDIVDKGVREAVRARLAAHNFKEKEAFKDIANNPIYLDPEHKRLPLRSVRCFTGLSAVVAVKYNEQGEAIGFVKPANNHHIAIYVDRDGKRIERVVTFWNAVERYKYGVPTIITRPSLAWDAVADRNLPTDFLENLPDPSWRLELSMQQNEMFVLGLSDEAFDEAIQAKDYKTLSKYLYRVQRLATKNYYFRLHIETKVDDKYSGVKNEMLSKSVGKLKVVSSLDGLSNLNPKKVKISLLGEIVESR